MGVNLEETDLSYSVCNGAKFYRCDGTGLRAEASEMKGASFYNCDLEGALFLHSNLAKANFMHCSAVGATFEQCCMEKTELGHLEQGQIYQAECSEDEEDWFVAEQGIEGNPAIR